MRSFADLRCVANRRVVEAGSGVGGSAAAISARCWGAVPNANVRASKQPPSLPRSRRDGSRTCRALQGCSRRGPPRPCGPVPPPPCSQRRGPLNRRDGGCCETIACGDRSFVPLGSRCPACGRKLARVFGAELILLHVVEDDRPLRLQEAERREATLLLEQAAGLPELRGLNARVLVLTGQPSDALLRAMESEAADLCMGASRRELLRNMFTGTTVEPCQRRRHFGAPWRNENWSTVRQAPAEPAHTGPQPSSPTPSVDNGDGKPPVGAPISRRRSRTTQPLPRGSFSPPLSC